MNVLQVTVQQKHDGNYTWDEDKIIDVYMTFFNINYYRRKKIEPSTMVSNDLWYRTYDQVD